MVLLVEIYLTSRFSLSESKSVRVGTESISRDSVRTGTLPSPVRMGSFTLPEGRSLSTR